MKADEELIPTRKSLLSKLKNRHDNESWEVFFDTYWKLIYGAALRAGLREAEAQDAVQETVISVMNSMPEFKYKTEGGSFKGWLLQLTTWRVVDQFRKRQKNIQSLHNNSETSTGTDPLDRFPGTAQMSIETIWDEEWEENLLNAAIDRVKRQVDARDFQIFDLYVVKKWPVAKV
ncbi:MAG: sigma-70 family RNA polymerase sigma factor, partial [Armatimonadetes bacterium]|nr:sigma-70 family RNA polymerase sigma factor [Akkermansiaceae bacterium]